MCELLFFQTPDHYSAKHIIIMCRSLSSSFSFSLSLSLYFSLFLLIAGSWHYKAQYEFLAPGNSNYECLLHLGNIQLNKNIHIVLRGIELFSLAQMKFIA